MAPQGGVGKTDIPTTLIENTPTLETPVDNMAVLRDNGGANNP